MDDTNQITVPESFLALYRKPHSTRLVEPWQHVWARYEWCEDFAGLLVQTAGNMMHDLGIHEDDVFERVHAGLCLPGATTTPAESFWVLQRLAELMHWHGSLESYRPVELAPV